MIEALAILALVVVVALVWVIVAANIDAEKVRVRALSTCVLVCGATGVGKSTLINTLAGRAIADVGIGSPVTQNTLRLEVPDKQLIFYDSRGMEVAESSQTYLLLLSDLLRVRFTAQIREQIDLVLMCIQDPQNRYDDAHSEIAALCEDLAIPYGIAITKWEGDGELGDHIRAEFRGAKFVLPVRSLELKLGQLVIPAMGLDEILIAIRSVPTWTVASAQERGRTAMKTEALSLSARQLAATFGQNPYAWINFGAAAMSLLDQETLGWYTTLSELRARTRRHYVPNVLVRNLFTKFDENRIDSTNASHIVPLIMKRFGDGSRRLQDSDIERAWTQAIYQLENDKPYRSRF